VMYANYVSVTIHDYDAAVATLTETILPMIKSQPGFQGGTWTADLETGQGHALVVFDTEENALAAAAMVPPGGDDEPVTRSPVTTIEVVAHV